MLDDGFFERMDKHHQQQAQEFWKLLDDATDVKASVGDQVLVAGFLIGHGAPWIRVEATVLAVTESSYQIEVASRVCHEKAFRYWIHKALVLDVLTSRP